MAEQKIKGVVVGTEVAHTDEEGRLPHGVLGTTMRKAIYHNLREQHPKKDLQTLREAAELSPEDMPLPGDKQ